MSHRDSVTGAARGARVVAGSSSTPIAAFEHAERKLYGVQFHPEVVHTPCGMEVLKNFLYSVADAPATWTAAAVIEEQVERIRAQVGSERVLCALSGGVDSAVAALLVHKAVGDQLTCVLVDPRPAAKGRSRAGRRDVSRPLSRSSDPRRRRGAVPGTARGVDDPEEKRTRIGEEFIRVFEAEARKLGATNYLVQGTLYSDVIESGGTEGVAAKIKSQPQTSAACPKKWRWSLSSRCASCSRTRSAVSARSSGCRANGLATPVSRPGPGDQDHRRGHSRAPRDPARGRLDPARRDPARGPLPRALAVLRGLAPIRSVGVQGDERTYAYPIVVRAVTSEDAMTADWARLPYDLWRRSRAGSSTRSRL
jgi:GMP synthase (glutamine-hydrolysing)